MPRERLDQILVHRGLVESREKAQRLIRAGRVKVTGQTSDKPGHQFPDDAVVEVTEAERFVGRGGHKLEAALEHFQVTVQDSCCIDVGASTGGFTDCLLQHGAAHVYAVDTGKGQLHQKLREDPRVTVFEKTNARYLSPDAFPTPPSLAVVDVSFISLVKVLPAIHGILTPKAQLVTLIKPQFEAGPSQVGKGGVVRDEKVRQEVVERIRTFCTDELGLVWQGQCVSPLKGPAGNVEFLAAMNKES